MAEDLTDYFLDRGYQGRIPAFRCRYFLPGGVLRQLHEGKIDVTVGINLLREGLRTFRVFLFAILRRRRQEEVPEILSFADPGLSGVLPVTVSGNVIMHATIRSRAMSRLLRRRTAAVKCRWRIMPGMVSTRHRLSKRSAMSMTCLAKEDIDTQTLLDSGYRNSGKAGSSPS